MPSSLTVNLEESKKPISDKMPFELGNKNGSAFHTGGGGLPVPMIPEINTRRVAIKILKKLKIQESSSGLEFLLNELHFVMKSEYIGLSSNARAYFG